MCARSSGSSSAIRTSPRRSTGCSRRRAKAAGCRKRCASPAPAATPARWLRFRVRPLRRTASATRAAPSWTVADVTRDRERQENVFQELQHAIDYLDHAPAGFFSVDAGRQHRLSQRDARRLARPRSRPVRLRRPEARRHRGRARARRCSTTLAGRARRREDRDARPRSQDPRRPHRAGPAVPQGRLRRRRHAGRLAHAGAQPRARRRQPTRSAPRKCASCASSTTPRWRSRPSTRHGRIARTQCAVRPAASTACSRATAASIARSSPSSPSATAPRWKPRSPRRRTGQGDIAPVDGALAGDGRPLGALLRLGGRGRRARRRGRDRLRARDDRAAHAGEPGRPEQKMQAGRPARRRHRARLQQRALRHHDGDRLPAQRAQADRSVVPGHHADQAERQPRREPGAASARLLAPADAAAAGARSRRGAVRPHHAAAPADRREGRRSTSCTGATSGRSRPTLASSSR